MSQIQMIEVEAVRRFGIEDNSELAVSGVRMVEVGEKVKIPKDAAKKLQDAGAIKVSI